MFKGTKNAFTLAEVLITLGIIGVVAAMTMPTLMGSTQEAQFKTAFKKNMSVVGQAISIAAAKNGEDLSVAPAGTSVSTALQTTGSVVNILNEGLSKINNDVSTVATNHKVDGSDFSSTNSVTQNATYDTHFYLQDGTSVHASSKSKECTAAAPCSIIIDTNGPKGPNLLNKAEASADTTHPKKGYCKALVGGTTYAKDPQTGTDIGSMQDNGDVCTATALISDQFEVLIYDDRVLPRNAVGRYVFYGAK